jgi:hypothetical protein
VIAILGHDTEPRIGSLGRRANRWTRHHLSARDRS